MTSQRLIVVRAAGSLDFVYSRVKALDVDLDAGAIALQFTGETVPLRLRGVTVPVVALLTAYDLLGPNWMNDTRFARLR